MLSSISLGGVLKMTVKLIDGSDFGLTELILSESRTPDHENDPQEDAELSAVAFENGATHLSVETGCFYKVGAEGYVSFFKKDSGGSICEIPSGYEEFEIHQAGFIPLGELGSSMQRALRSIASYWEMTGAHFGAIVLCGLPSTGKSWLCSELDRRGMKNVESYSLYGFGSADVKNAMAIIKEEIAYHNASLGHLVFSAPSLELAKALEDYMQVFYIEGSPMDAIRKSLN